MSSDIRFWKGSKQLARFQRVGHRITGDPRKCSLPGACYDKVRIAVENANRLDNGAVLPE